MSITVGRLKHVRTCGHLVQSSFGRYSIMGWAFSEMEHSPYKNMVGVSFHFTKWSPLYFNFGCALCWATPTEKGHYWNKDPLGSTSGGSLFNNAPLLRCYPTHKVPVENILCIWRTHYLAEFLVGKRAFHFFSPWWLVGILQYVLSITKKEI